MGKKITLWMSALVLAIVGLSSCSGDGEEMLDANNDMNISFLSRNTGTVSGIPGDLNVLEIREVEGQADTCWICDPLCGIAGPVTVSGPDGTTYVDHQMKFTATLKNSAHFTGLHLGIENRENRRIEDLEVGESYSTYHFNAFNKISSSMWGDTYSNKYGAWSGGIEVVGKRTDPYGTTFVTISIKDLEGCAYDENWDEHTYFLNGKIEFRINDGGFYPEPEERINEEEVLNPLDELVANSDPSGAFAPLCERWCLQSYSDPDGTLHQVDSDWGDERYTIEFMSDGSMQGRINTNNFSGRYTVPSTCTLDGKNEGYNGEQHYGLLSLSDYTGTMVNDNEPLSKEFMRIFNATEFKLWSSDFLTIKVSDQEYFAFFRENLKASYGFSK